MFHFHRILSLLCVSFLFVFFGDGLGFLHAEETHLYVDGIYGSNANKGLTEDSAFQTIQYAVDQAKPGTTIHILPGQYDENIVLKPGTAEAPIHLVGKVPDMTLLGKPIPILPENDSSYPVFQAKVDEPAIFNVVDLHNGALRRVANSQEVTELAGSFYYAKDQGILHGHLAGYQTPATRVLFGISNPGSGILMADHTTVEGLTISGFGSAGIQSDNANDIEIRDCIFYANACGIAIFGGSDIRILHNKLWRNGFENNPLWWKGRSSKYAGHISLNPIKSVIKNAVIDDNIAAYSNIHGIRFYAGRGAENCVLRGNVVYGNAEMGLFFKTPIIGENSAENNITFRNNPDLRAPITTLNLVDAQAQYPSNPDHWKIFEKDNERLKEHPSTPLFVSPFYDDFRIHPAHPLAETKAAKAFAERQGNGIVEIAPSQLTEEWSKAIQPGQTLLLKQGNAEDVLLLENLEATENHPTVIRAQNTKVRFKGIMVRNCKNLIVQGIRIGKEGIKIVHSENIRFENGSVTQAEQNGIAIQESTQVRLHKMEVSDSHSTGIQWDDASRYIGISASQFSNQKGAHLAGNPVALIWTADNRWDDSAPLLIMYHDKPVSMSLLTAQGGRNLPFPVFHGEQDFGPSTAIEKGWDPIDQVRVHSVTPTTANILFRTPGIITGTMIEWGETEAYGEKLDHALFENADAETAHSISLLNLKPGTTYHYRVGFRDPWNETLPSPQNRFPIRDTPNQRTTIWSKDYTFITPTENKAPQKFYVSTNGDDTQDGLHPDTAWKTLHKAASEAGPGDVVTIAPGSYFEALRPFHTGESKDRPIIFRAEKPLTVFLNGGVGKDTGSQKIDEISGRPYCVVVHGKAFLTFENLSFVGSELNQNTTRGLGDAYSAQVDISGSKEILFSGCVFDGRGNYNVGIRVRNGGDMVAKGSSEVTARIMDSLLYHNFYMGIIQNLFADLVFEHSALVNGQIYGFQTDVSSDENGKLVFKDNVIAFLPASTRKLLHPFIYTSKGSDIGIQSEGNCFVWDDIDDSRIIIGEQPFNVWLKSDQDKGSFEGLPSWPLWQQVGLNRFSEKNRSRIVSSDPLKISDLVSPTQDKFHAGPRWGRYLEK